MHPRGMIGILRSLVSSSLNMDERWSHGKGASDALHNGTDLNGKQAEVASSLLDKMGLADITPDNGGPSSRAAPPAPKKR